MGYLVCKNIVPTLRLAETYSGGYMKYYLPLALNSKMVMSSLLTVSASHMQLLQLRNIAVHRYIYRSITFTELQQASSEQDPNHVLPLLALASILGLLIEDIIAGTAEFPALLRMTQFWICRDHFHNYGPQEKTTLRFLLDQIQL